MRARILPEAEWARVADRPPFDQVGLPDPAHWLIPVVEIEGRIVASCAIFDTVHWDAFAIDADCQRHPAIFRCLLDLSVATLQESGVPGAHITVPLDRPDLQAMVERFGFVPAPGRLYIYAVPPRKSET
jgi:hypothetical protein